MYTILFLSLYMDLVSQLIYNFIQTERLNTFILVFVCLLINLIQTNGISIVTAKIINSVEKGTSESIFYLFYIFVIISVFYLILNYVYMIYENKLLTKLFQWIKSELVKVVMKNNNENFSDINFVNLITPITRIASVSFNMINAFITSVLPLVLFILVISIYFLYNDPLLGIIFIICNLLVVSYMLFVWEDVMKMNKDYEETAANNENQILEVLNNMDRIIYRGQTDKEIEKLEKLAKKTIDKAYDYYSFTSTNTMFMYIFIYFVIFGFLYYNLVRVVNKKLPVVVFITFFTIILLYREKMSNMIVQIQDFGEFLGRIRGVIGNFDGMKYDLLNKYTPKNLEFNTVKFENVSFQYKTGKKPIFTNLNLELNFHDNIIGIVGKSGRGKSTFMKLVLKMYNNYTGEIYIDGVNIKEIDPDYIRSNITYVNQNSKLFDKVVVENIMYGCSNNSECVSHLNNIIENYPKIKELFNKIDIYKKKSGPLGENLSGGQRQVVNIIGGLINPSKILLLDEPTNALDKELKQDIISVIREFRNYKKSIIIITHDRDVYSLFDEKIEM